MRDKVEVKFRSILRVAFWGGAEKIPDSVEKRLLNPVVSV